MFESEYLPRKIYIEKESFDFPLTRRILNNASPVPQEIVDDPQDIFDDIKISRNSRGEGKKYLLLTRQKGDFVKPCPCTPHYIGCNYFIINLNHNCPLGCSYCVLQHYLTNALVTVHVNLKDLWRELDIFLEKNRGKTIRIGTGELGDSLAIDHLTENSIDLISYFRGKRDAIFELKTKTVNINNILKTEPARNIVVAWSINSTRIADEEEKGAPPVEHRIDAARRVSERGYWVGFHFDPIVRYPGWEKEYEAVIKKLLEAVPPARIAWISLGSLRFVPMLKMVIKEKFPRKKIICDEFIKGKDGKLRYFRPLRLELYQRIIDFIRKWGGRKVRIYFCMENESIWRDSLGWVPGGKEDVEAYLSSPFGPSIAG